jgi:hypothetical protein
MLHQLNNLNVSYWEKISLPTQSSTPCHHTPQKSLVIRFSIKTPSNDERTIICACVSLKINMNQRKVSFMESFRLKIFVGHNLSA